MPLREDFAAYKWYRERWQHEALLRRVHRLTFNQFSYGDWTNKALFYPFPLEPESARIVKELYSSVILKMSSPTVTGPDGLGMTECAKRIGSAHEFISVHKKTPDVLILLLRKGSQQYEVIDGHHRIAAASHYCVEHMREFVACPSEILQL